MKVEAESLESEAINTPGADNVACNGMVLEKKKEQLQIQMKLCSLASLSPPAV